MEHYSTVKKYLKHGMRQHPILSNDSASNDPDSISKPDNPKDQSHYLPEINTAALFARTN
jgi:hypothetical protein